MTRPLKVDEKTEEEIRRARREWEDIFQAIGHPTTILAPDHTIIGVNRATIKATGCSKEELWHPISNEGDTGSDYHGYSTAGHQWPGGYQENKGF